MKVPFKCRNCKKRYTSANKSYIMDNETSEKKWDYVEFCRYHLRNISEILAEKCNYNNKKIYKKTIVDF